MTRWPEAAAEPTPSVPPRRGLGHHLVRSLQYVLTIESHVYAFAISANVLLCFFPFMVLMLSLTGKVLRWPAAVDVIFVGLQGVLPADPGLVDFVERNLKAAVATRQREALSLVLLLFASNGIFVPLEVALNRLWGFTKDRNYLVNQVLCFTFACVAGSLALTSTVLASLATEKATSLWATSPRLVQLLTETALHALALPSGIAILLLVYWLLPNGPVRLRQVFPAAVLTACALLVAKEAYIRVWPALDFRAAYGPFFISITLLVWGYVSAMIVLAGAELSTRWRRPPRDGNGRPSPLPPIPVALRSDPPLASTVSRGPGTPAHG
jgi:membrane protein